MQALFKGRGALATNVSSSQKKEGRKMDLSASRGKEYQGIPVGKSKTRVTNLPSEENFPPGLAGT